MKKENLMLLLSFFGLILSGILIYIMHQRIIYLETRDPIIKVIKSMPSGEENE